MYQSLRIIHPAGMSGGTAYYRVLGPSSLLKLNGYHQVHITLKVLTDDELDLLNPDSVVWQSQYTTDQIEAIERYRRKKPNMFMVYELNDNFWDIPDKNLFKKDIPVDIKNRLARIFKSIDRVICSNEVLTNLVKKVFYLKDVVTVPNSLPEEMYRIFDTKSAMKRITSDKPRVGWAGGIAHQGDLETISDLVNKTIDKYQWVFFGSIPPNVDPEKIEFHAPVEFSQYLFSLYYMNLDIGIAPLEAHTFNQSKSNLRIIEYTAAGITAVALNYGPYSDQPCVKVNSPDEWEQKIDYALSHKNELFREQKDYIKKNHTSEDFMEIWDDAWGSSKHVPEDVELSNEIVVVSQGQTLPAHDKNLLTYSSLEEAHTKHPNANILWVDSATWVSNTFIDKALSIVKDSSVKIGSVCTLSNRGDFLSFPEMYKVNSLTQKEAEAVVDGICQLEGNPYLPIPHPSGPVVYMSNQALRKIGLPRVNNFPPEMAFAEWGASLKICGLDSMVVMSEYSYTLNTIPFSKELLDGGIARLQMYFPEKKQHYDEWSKKYDDYVKKRQKIEILMHKNLPTYPSSENKTYSDWIKWFDSPNRKTVLNYYHESAPKEKNSKFGIVLPVFRPDLKMLQDTLMSVVNQTYGDYHIAIVVDEKYEDVSKELRLFLLQFKDFYAPFPLDKITIEYNTENQGISKTSNRCLNVLKDHAVDWVFFLDNEDIIPIHCLSILNEYIINNEKAVMFYTDSDLISVEGIRSEPFFKPNFDYTRLLAQNYLNHLTLYKYKNIEEIGFLSEKYEGSQDYDLIFRYIEKFVKIEGARIDQEKVVHIPRVLYHWRTSEGSVAQNIGNKPWAVDAGRDAVRDHLVRTQGLFFVGNHPALPQHYLVRPLVDKDKKDLVSIIIPFKDKIDYLERCLSSLLSKTAYSYFEILLVNNGSKEKRTKRYLESIRDPRIRIIDYPFEFNYSVINNEAVKQSKGDYILFLNDDTEICEPAWLTDMLGYASKKEIGFVGARLIYGNGTIQHVGVQTKVGMVYHYDRFKPMASSGYYGIDQLSHESMAVTGACMMIQKDKFIGLGMFDPQFKVCYGDVDVCLRAFDSGYTNVVCMTSTLFHHESATRGSMESGGESHQKMLYELALLQQKHRVEDHYINPNHDMTKGFEAIVWPPAPFPWDKSGKDRKWVLSINATSDECAHLWNMNYKILDFEFYGPVAKLNNPNLKNFRPWDVFGDWKGFLGFIDSFDYDKTFFFGIRNSYPEILRYISKKLKNVDNLTPHIEQICPRRTGKIDNDTQCDNTTINVVFGKTDDDIVYHTSNPDDLICSRCIEDNGTPYGFIDIKEWRSVWELFDPKEV